VGLDKALQFATCRENLLKKHVAVTASTGIAATKCVGEVTFHRWSVYGNA